ncbi:uncharacterized protein LOC141910672 [Tubulanus polymorphus]|uniref:uncharacterized protein LOC141910672 n=1 Tax=Tubulanus polymorphus TaxID=672921 RepID=UPI003DA66707
MADSVGGGGSKSAAKNRKRREKKSRQKSDENGLTSSGQTTEEELLIDLKQQLEVAKESKDHKAASTIRQQIWVVTDLVNGVTPKLSEQELDKLMKDLPLSNQQEEKPQEASPPPVKQTLGLTPTQRNLASLHKKLDQISALKQRQKCGEQLEKNQLQKIETEAKLIDEIGDLEEILRSTKI